MNSWSLSHLADTTLSRDLASSFIREQGPLATTLAHIAEFDARKLYVPAAYPTMHAYLLGEFHLSGDEAYKRIQAARAAYKFPAIYDMVTDARLNLTAVVLLAPHLLPENAAELLAEALHKTKAQLQLLLAERFPKADAPSVLRPLTSAGGEVAAASESRESPGIPDLEAGRSTVHSLVPEPAVPSVDVELTSSPGPLPPNSDTASVAVSPSPRPLVAPLSPGRFELRVTLDQDAHDKLRRLQELLSHAVPSGDLARILGRTFELAIEKLEKRRFATTNRPSARRRSKSARHIPAHVRREVSDRDRYLCTFVSASGRRCAEKRFLEYDHVRPVARGGEATVENTRLRCRAHNQYEAERMYGAGFMREKRQAARAAAQVPRVRSKGAASASSVRDRNEDTAASA